MLLFLSHRKSNIVTIYKNRFSGLLVRNSFNAVLFQTQNDMKEILYYLSELNAVCHRKIGLTGTLRPLAKYCEICLFSRFLKGKWLSELFPTHFYAVNNLYILAFRLFLANKNTRINLSNFFGFRNIPPVLEARKNQKNSPYRISFIILWSENFY